MNVILPGTRPGFQPLAQLVQLVRRRSGSDLDAERVVHPGEVLGMGAVGGARTLAQPEHVRGAVVPVAGQRVLTRQALFVVEHCWARVDVDLVQLA